MCGNELVVKYDIGLEFDELPDWTVHPERVISTPEGLDERLGIVNPRSFPGRSAKTGRLCGSIGMCLGGLLPLDATYVIAGDWKSAIVLSRAEVKAACLQICVVHSPLWFQNLSWALSIYRRDQPIRA